MMWMVTRSTLSPVQSISKIINPAHARSYSHFREVYTTKRKRFDNDDELYVFHGTKPEHVDNIIENNLTALVSRANRRVWGLGHYFAKNASYPLQSFMQAPCVFLCRLTVGKMDMGIADTLLNITKYDCGVDDVRNPTIFVAPQPSQFLIEYLITFDPLRYMM